MGCANDVMGDPFADTDSLLGLIRVIGAIRGYVLFCPEKKKSVGKILAEMFDFAR